MRRFLIVAISLLSIAASIHTAAAQSQSYNWTGWYVGVNAGGAWGDSDIRTSTVFAPGNYFQPTSVPSINSNGHGSPGTSGFTAGAQGGYNWQVGNWVLGLETDFGYFDQDTSRSVTVVYPCCGPSTYTIDQKVDTDNLFTLRPRAGWAANNWLFYVSGGLALSSLKTSFEFTDVFGVAADGEKTSIKPGWAIGGGAEFGLLRNWTLRGEYLYVDFDDVSLKSSNLNFFGVPSPGNVFTHKADLSSHIVRVALNFRF
jgi:outer membrane immunogenic protein